MLRHIRRIVIAIVGGLVLALGVAMLVLPGPAVVVIPAGLAILATEFEWARRLLDVVRRRLKGGLSFFKRRTSPGGPAPQSERPSGASRVPDGRSTHTDTSRSSELRAS
jgi:hypothetical protein